MKQKLDDLRKAIKDAGVDAYLQPVHDAYMSEYPPACYQRVQWLTGFSGSAGSVAVMDDAAAVFSDGRYTLQLKQELDAALYESYNTAELLPYVWLCKHLAAGSTIGYDAALYTQTMYDRIHAYCASYDIALVPIANVIDAVWADQPDAPASAIFIHDEAFAGASSVQKRGQVAQKLKEHKADFALLTAPDSICWLLNIRARDVENTPLLLASALIDSNGQVQLFVKSARCDDAVQAHLGADVLLQDPDTLGEQLASLPGKRILCDPAVTPLWFTQALSGGGSMLIYSQDPCVMLKACKNDVELENIRAAHIRDGAALAKLLFWVDETTQQRDVSELEISDQLLAYRAEHPMFLEPSFFTIAGSGPNGAIVHYRPTKANSRLLGDNELLLLDSGGQYPDGTTDITRTVIIGEPTTEMRDRFTRVLKGHIAIATSVFPYGTSGSQLDGFARQPLWQAELDYDHGTGHGVGMFLNVHEGPQRISKRGGDTPLEVGMVVSNEPGYYATGEYGIRIESLVTVVEARVNHDGRRWLTFDTLSCAPIDKRLIDEELLSEEERAWLNAYHHWVFDMLASHLDDDAREWLEDVCAAI